MNDHVAEPFRSILNSFAEPKQHIQRQATRRDLDRYKALSAVHAELELAGAVIDIGQLDWAVSEVTNRLHEASLDRQFAEKRAREAESLERWKSKAEDEEAEREERRQYRAWRNDSGV